jgi:hypothetical protein
MPLVHVDHRHYLRYVYTTSESIALLPTPRLSTFIARLYMARGACTPYLVFLDPFASQRDDSLSIK